MPPQRGSFLRCFAIRALESPDPTDAQPLHSAFIHAIVTPDDYLPWPFRPVRDVVRPVR